MIVARENTELDSSMIKNSIANDSPTECKFDAATSAETHCVIPMRVRASVNVYARVHARVSSFPLLRREKEKWTFLVLRQRAYSPVIRSQPVCFLCLNMCTALCALPYLLINDLPSETPRSFLPGSLSRKGSFNHRCCKKKKWLKAKNFAIYRHY